MNKIKKVIIAAIGVLLSAVFLCGCTEAERVTYNVQKEADNFNVTRRLSVINARSDKPVLELIGNFSISNNEANELVVTIEIAPNVYKVDYVYLNDWTMSDSNTGGQTADIHVTVDIDGDTVGETVARYNAVRNRRLNGRS